ncbi:hypothetical protein CRG98_001464 [Punica granatum]|uniref:Uncharacterized protein n=1 Tax=Punica granatum TaxID=22663 RepID=A0A2I0LD50_PUNGR|nr:hypothetical protein CRG98_001464 [Punica granatum]
MEITLGMEFDSLENFKNAIRENNIALGREIKFEKNDNVRIHMGKLDQELKTSKLEEILLEICQGNNSSKLDKTIKRRLNMTLSIIQKLGYNQVLEMSHPVMPFSYTPITAETMGVAMLELLQYLQLISIQGDLLLLNRLNLKEADAPHFVSLINGI